ncbi:unnamed protein product [Parnassius mnemosyne]
MMVQAHELGCDYEHCSALLRKLDDLDSDMKVDDRRLRALDTLAERLLRQGPTASAGGGAGGGAGGVAARRDAVLARWRALSGALHAYRERLDAALLLHCFNR